MTDEATGGDRPAVEEAERDDPGRVLYAVFQTESDTALRLSTGLAASADGGLVVGEVDGDGAIGEYETSRDVAEAVFQSERDPTIEVPVEGHSLSGEGPPDAIATAATAYDVEAVVMGEAVSERVESRLATKVGCTTVVVNDRVPLKSIASVLVPVAGGAHSGAAVEFAGAVARANDAWVELVHVSDPETDDESGTRLLDGGRDRLAGVEVDARVVDGEDVAATIVEESNYHDLTVIGAPESGRLRRMIFGSTAADVRDEAQSTVAMVRRGAEADDGLFSGSLR